MRRTILVILTILCAFMSNIFFISCQNKNDIFDHDDGFEIGYSYGVDLPQTHSCHIGIKSDISVFKIGEVSINISYGFKGTELMDIDKWVVDVTSSNYKDGHIILKTINDWNDKKYDYLSTQDENNRFIWLITYDYTEQLRIPMELFIEEEGLIFIRAYADDNEKVDSLSGKPLRYAMQVSLNYYKYDDYVWLGTKEYKYR